MVTASSGLHSDQTDDRPPSDQPFGQPTSRLLGLRWTTPGGSSAGRIFWFVCGTHSWSSSFHGPGRLVRRPRLPATQDRVNVAPASRRRTNCFSCRFLFMVLPRLPGAGQRTARTRAAIETNCFQAPGAAPSRRRGRALQTRAPEP